VRKKDSKIMNEQNVARSLIHQIETVARIQQVKKVLAVVIQVGARSHVSSDYLRDCFSRDSEGTIADGAWLVIDMMEDTTDPKAGEVVLKTSGWLAEGRLEAAVASRTIGCRTTAKHEE